MDQPNPAVAANQSYALLNPLDLYKTETYQKLQHTVPRAASLSWMKHLKGYTGTRKTKRHEYSFYQEGQYFKGSAVIAAISANGAKFDITLSLGDHSSVSGTNKDSFVVEGMLVLFQDSMTTGYVEVKDTTSDGAHEITVKKTDSSQDIASVALVGSNMVFFSNVQKEGSGGTDSRVEQYTKITNTMTTVREKFQVMDHEMQNQAWFEPVPGKKYLWYKGIYSTAERFEMQCDLSNLISNQSSGLTDKNGAGLQTMKGLTPQIREGGYPLEYYGRPDGDAFDQVMLALDNNYGGEKYFIGRGHNLQIDMKNFLVEFAKAGTGNISFSPFDGGSEQAIKIGFKSYSVDAYEFYFQTWKVLSHKDTIGAQGMKFRHYGYFVPAGKTRDANPELPEGAPEHVPYIMEVTPPLDVMAGNPNLVKGDYLMWETGALASQGSNNEFLHKEVHMAKYFSLEMRCRHKFLLWEKA